MTDAFRKVSVSPYIVGGRDSKIGDHPYQVLLEIRGIRCSGSIISQYHILTAAHCLQPYTSNEIGLWYGMTSVDPSQRGKKYTAKHIEIHPYYDSKSMNNDVGIIWVSLNDFNVISTYTYHEFILAKFTFLG